ncbi:MAG: FtsQ-type POTRA domain-containing protein [Candidatus Staskawiczbacteria bacterium]|jgi:cell division septal protein FtsQ
MSYRKSHVKNKIHKIKPKKSILKRLWFWLLILFFIVVFSALYFLLFYPGIQIKNVVVSGNNEIKAQDLQDIILNNSNTGLVKFWNVNLTSKSIFLADTSKLEKEILEKFPIIEKVSVNKQFPQTITLGIAERKPIGVYCSQTQQCFLIDENGVIYEPLNAPPADYIVVQQALENNNVFAGQNIVEQNIIAGISEIQKDLKNNFQINVKGALIASPLRLNITTDGGWQIYFNLSGDPDINSQITKLNLLLNGDVNANARKTLQYIDVRFKDMASYK